MASWLDPLTRVACVESEMCGATAIAFEAPFCAVAHQVGNAPATREYAALQPGSTVTHIHGVYLSGNSAFGLAGAEGVMRYQRERGVGYNTRFAVIPVVPAACIYDLQQGAAQLDHTLSPLQVYASLKNEAVAFSQMPIGLRGAGKNATCAKIFSDVLSFPGGISHCTKTLESGPPVQLTALVLLNPAGTIRLENGDLCGYSRGATSSCLPKLQSTNEASVATIGTSTTIVTILVGVSLRRNELLQIARMASAGLGESLYPCFTPLDGDIVFVVSVAEEQSQPTEDVRLVMALGACASAATAEAIRSLAPA